MTKRETRLAEELEDLRKSYDIALRLLQQALEEVRRMTKAERRQGGSVSAER